MFAKTKLAICLLLASSLTQCKHSSRGSSLAADTVAVAPTANTSSKVIWEDRVIPSEPKASCEWTRTIPNDATCKNSEAEFLSQFATLVDLAYEVSPKPEGVQANVKVFGARKSTFSLKPTAVPIVECELGRHQTMLRLAERCELHDEGETLVAGYESQISGTGYALYAFTPDANASCKISLVGDARAENQPLFPFVAFKCTKHCVENAMVAGTDNRCVCQPGFHLRERIIKQPADLSSVAIDHPKIETFCVSNDTPPAP